MQEFTAKSSSLFTLCPETPINRAFQGVKSEEYFFVSLVKKRNKGKGEGCSRRTVH